MLLVCVASVSLAADKPAQPQEITHRIGGLNAPDRVDDLRHVMAGVQDVRLVDVNFERAEATFAYDPKKVSVDRIKQALGAMMFSLKPPLAVPREKLLPVTIDVAGLDCRGCSLGAYNVVAKIDGVEQATANFKDGKVTALIDPARTNRKALEEGLTKAGVEVVEHK